MSDHLVDIFDENYNYVGTELKSIAHQKGLWHRVFTCIIVNKEKNTIYFQKKVSGRYVFNRPDYIDITVGGHYMAGENIETGKREIEEETGFCIDFEDLVDLGVRQSSFSAESKYFANEFQHLFLLDKDCKLEDFCSIGNEVKGMVEVDIDGMLSMLLAELPSVKGRYGYNINGNYTEQEIVLTLNDIVPDYMRKDKLFLRLLIVAKRYCNSESNKYLYW